MAQKLTAEARKAALGKLSQWSEVSGRDAITRKFVFKDFQRGFWLHDASVAWSPKRWTTTPNGSMSTRQSRSRCPRMTPAA